MQNDLFAARLRITELLLEAVGDSARLREALRVMQELIGADVGMLAWGRRGNAGIRGVMSTERGMPCGKYDGTSFPCFELYRRCALSQPDGRLVRDTEVLGFAHACGMVDAADAIALQAVDGLERRMAHLGTIDDHMCYVGFARRASAARFDEERVRAVEEMLPSLRQACATMFELRSMQALSSAAIDRYERYHVGMVMVDDEGAVLYCNEAARRLFGAGHALCVDGNGCLAARDAAQADALMQSVRGHIARGRAAQRPEPSLHKLPRDAARPPLLVAVNSYRGADGRATNWAVVLIYNPDHPPVQRAEVIRNFYELNPQEAQLVCAIAAGDSLEDIARHSSRSLEAVRSQLKRVFRKTGTSRQTQLVKLVLSGPASMVH